ncbi:efflux transporter periplasmic adaptor subunit [Idiomarina tyrosinivorans]|uniref:Efflux transporter periplasmic adaptor subunit n=1 Tax=Idiomarina tyrosinivorans TaxID=1445662 RepID=A0A432ZSQ7_9GAMM|nr:efflux RND transporter periplasmic adaptor subunit [Idiomarina tyrosinivorans]RUO80836.1 efflux transporter periplasmic adaptor subunit [Idiomarina tyrosinivorans]
MTKWLTTLLFASSLLMPMASQAQQREQRAELVIVQPLQFERAQQVVEAVGTAQAMRSVALYPNVADRVTGVHFTPGEHVDAGELLLELDARHQRIAVQQAQITLRDAERKVTRLRKSEQGGAVPQSELDDAITARDLAAIALDQARVELDDRRVYAPFAGVVGLTDVEVGDRITEQTLITTIDDRSQLLIEFTAPESALPLLQQGAELRFSPWAFADRQVTATAVELDSRIDPQTRMIRARAKIPNPNDEFLPGMSFRATLSLAGECFAVIPEAALLWGANSPYVWLAKQQTAQRIEVQIEQRLAGRVLVSGELHQGDILITEGVQSLRDGQAIRYQHAQLDEPVAEQEVPAAVGASGE